MLSANNSQLRCFFWNPIFITELLSEMPRKTVESFAHIKQRKQYSEGSTVFVAGDFPSSIYVLTEGQATLILDSNNKSERAARPAEKNEILGLTETIACLPHSTNLVTILPCVFEIIERRDLIHFLSREAEVSFRLVKLLGMNLQKHCFPASHS